MAYLGECLANDPRLEIAVLLDELLDLALVVGQRQDLVDLEKQRRVCFKENTARSLLQLRLDLVDVLGRRQVLLFDEHPVESQKVVHDVVHQLLLLLLNAQLRQNLRVFFTNLPTVFI